MCKCGGNALTVCFLWGAVWSVSTFFAGAICVVASEPRALPTRGSFYPGSLAWCIDRDDVEACLW
jgi:hypothetical protein